MPKNDTPLADASETSDVSVPEIIVPEVPETKVPLIAFSYPTVGDGVTIYAQNQAEADARMRAHPLFRKS